MQVDGNRLKISPQVRKISAANSTNAHGAYPRLPNSQIGNSAETESDRHGVFAADVLRNPAESSSRSAIADIVDNERGAQREGAPDALIPDADTLGDRRDPQSPSGPMPTP